MENSHLTLANSIFENFSTEDAEKYSPTAARGTEAWDETVSVLGLDWQKLSVSKFDANPYFFVFCDSEAFSYYFGALMYHMLIEDNFSSPSLDNFLYIWTDTAEIEFHVSSDAITEVGELARELSSNLDSKKTNDIKRFFEVRNENEKDGCGDLTNNFIRSVAT